MDEKSRLTLTPYVAGETAASSAGIGDLRRSCDGPLDGRYEIEVVDIRRRPGLAHDDRLLVQVLATPAIMGIIYPVLKRTIIDELIMREQVLLGANLQPAEEALQPTGGFG